MKENWIVLKLFSKSCRIKGQIKVWPGINWKHREYETKIESRIILRMVITFCYKVWGFVFFLNIFLWWTYFTCDLCLRFDASERGIFIPIFAQPQNELLLSAEYSIKVWAKRRAMMKHIEEMKISLWRKGFDFYVKQTLATLVPD